MGAGDGEEPGVGLPSVGQVVLGEVTRLAPFGAYVHVDDGFSALVHLVELSHRHVEVPEQVLRVGDSCLFEVIEVQPDQRRVWLSLRWGDAGAPGWER
jgi:small subunit ribosomal protein S1